MSPSVFARPRAWLVAAAALALASCEGLPGGLHSTQEVRAPVDRLVGERLGATGAAGIDDLLARPIDREAAVRIALARSSRLAAAFDELDIAEGDVASALGLGPVAVDGALRFGKDYNEYELSAVQNLLGLVAGSWRGGAARAELDAVRAEAAAAAIRLAAEVEIAFNDVLAAEQDVALRRTAFAAADTAAAVRERMQAAGNASELAVARDREAREQARLELGRAEAVVTVRREAINALLGLSGSRTGWIATGELPALSEQPPALDALEAEATAASLSLTAGRARRVAAEQRVSAERLASVLPELGAGVSVTNDGHETTVGPALRIGIPLFDQRSGPRARANAEARRADHVLDAATSELAAAARAARATALATYQEARQLRDVIVPLRQHIVDETLLHYNAMDADLFALILARRELVEATHQQLDAIRRLANAMASVRALRLGASIAPQSY